MAFSCRWAHPLKWARNPWFSLGRHGHSQAPILPAQAEIQSTTKDLFSELHRMWIWPWISHWVLSIRVEPRNLVGLCEEACLFLSKYFAARQRCWVGLLQTGCILPCTVRQHPCPLPTKPWGTPAFDTGACGRVCAWSRDLTFLACREIRKHRDGQDRAVQQQESGL